MVASIIAYIISGTLCFVAVAGLVIWVTGKGTVNTFWGCIMALLLAYAAAMLGGI